MLSPWLLLSHPSLSLSLSPPAAGNREYSAAVEAYTLALKLNPNDVTAHNNRAAAYLKLKHWDDAELDCTHALKLEASNWKAHMRRASARLEKGGEEHVRAARDDAAQALEINPNEKEIEVRIVPPPSA